MSTIWIKAIERMENGNIPAQATIFPRVGSTAFDSLLQKRWKSAKTVRLTGKTSKAIFGPSCVSGTESEYQIGTSLGPKKYASKEIANEDNTIALKPDFCTYDFIGSNV